MPWWVWLVVIVLAVAVLGALRGSDSPSQEACERLAGKYLSQNGNLNGADAERYARCD
jgi:hypothetical protein